MPYNPDDPFAPGGDSPYAGLKNPLEQGDPYTLEQYQYPEMPKYGFDPNQYGTYAQDVENWIGKQNQYDPAQMQSAQMALGGVPQPGAEKYGTSPELQRMLSGEGYNPQTVAQMKATAMEAPAQSGVQEMAAAKRALSQSGLGSSPAGAAIQEDVARRTGEQQRAGLRDVDIQNAQAGLENFRTGVGQQTQIGLSGMQAANEMALSNANRLFEAMNQNAGRQQQANALNMQGKQRQQENEAAAKSGFATQQGDQALKYWQGAQTQNTGEQIKRQQDQATDWQNIRNKAFDEQNRRYSAATGAMTNPQEIGA